MTLARISFVKASRRAQRSVSLAALALTGTAITCVPMAARAQTRWTGAASTDWFDPANWDSNAVPTAADPTIIDIATPHAAIIDGADAATGDLTVGQDATGDLTIRNAGTLGSVNGTIGQDAGSSGTVTVQAANSAWSLTQELTVGDLGAGSLAIGDGAKVTDGYATIGASGAGVGHVTVDGANSNWSNNGYVYVGGSQTPGGQGTLTIENGGIVDAGGMDIGAGIGSGGTVTVEGAGSGLNNGNGALAVGTYGNGKLSILDGGTVLTYNLYIGALTSDPAHVGTGIVELDDANSTLYVSNGVYVGGDNNIDPGSGTSGTLLVHSGSALKTTGDFIVGSSAGATGDVEVSGAGSTLTHMGDLFIGAAGGAGTVKFLAEGQGSAGDVVLGLGTQSSGTLLVDGAQTKLTADDLVVANQGNGTATVSGGGEIDAVALIAGSDTGTTGTVKVTDAGSRLNLSGDAAIGSGGTASLSILAGATATDQDAYLGTDIGAGSVTVDGAGSVWTTNAALSVGAAGKGTLNVQNGGKATSGHAEIGAGPKADGTVDVTGAGSTWATTDLIDAYSGTGMMTVEKGGTVTASTVDIGLGANSSGTMAVTGPGSSLTSTGLMDVGLGGTGTMTVEDGASAGTDVGDIGLQAGGTGTVTVDGAGSSWKNNSLTVGDAGTGTLNVRNGATVIAASSVAAYEANSSGTIDVDGAGSSLTLGSIVLGRYGTGTLTVSNGATLDDLPGVTLAQNTGSVGTLNIGAGAASPAAGAGDVKISVIGFGAGAGTINFNHTDQDYQFTPGMSGAGTINQIAGVTHLVSDSSGFSGTANVTGGTLYVDNHLGAGLVSVTGGGTLGGTGSIAGLVGIGAGATLLGVEGQTLTIDDLQLGVGANVDVTLDTPGGGALFNVTGDLQLNGTLNVSAPGAFGPGVYSLFTYTGPLGGAGLAIGSTPAGISASDLSIQTSVAGQVNLVDAKPLDRLFWDGDAAGSANNHAVDGGSGVWSAAGANWTDVGGAGNGAMAPQPGFAIFENKSGIVTVDASAGPVAVTGMQFATDGYVVVGDPITLTDPNSVIRVGNGSAAGAGYVATIESALTGTGGLNKTDLGTLVLGGTNSYTGGTTVSAGTLQIGDGSAGGYASVLGKIVDNAQLVFDNQASPTETSNDISGSGSVRIRGTTILTGTGSYTGGTAIDAGARLYVGSNGTIGSIVGNVANSGELVFNRSDDFTFGGVISGTGIVFQNGGGRTVLTGVNTYTGETGIADGTIALAGNDRSRRPARSMSATAARSTSRRPRPVPPSSPWRATAM